VSEPRSAAASPLSTPRFGALREFIATENASAVVLLSATILALLWANSPWSDTYEELWRTDLAIRIGDHVLSMDLRHWINDGLMAMFFFVVGLEIRRELDMGELRERRRVTTPVIAAVGGMVVPALIFIAVNAGDSAVRGWGIVMGTDTAFALGVLMLVGGATPRVRTFLLTLVIVDDVVALTVIAVVYTSDLDLVALAAAVALLGVIVVLRAAGVRHLGLYSLIAVGVWLATLLSGVHATIAGVAMGVLATAYPPTRSDLAQAGSVWRRFREEPTPEYARAASRSVALTISPNEHLQHVFHPWTSYLIVPLFALANAGVTLSGSALERAVASPITFGIVAGLVGGKLIGITGSTFLVTRRRLGDFPLTVPWAPLVGVATVAGIGFTVSLLIADISFDGEQLEDAKLGILAASLLASVLAWAVFHVIDRLSTRVRRAGVQRLAPPIVDLAEMVNPAVDHVRGPTDAAVTLVEYGDFECPYCGSAEMAVRELAREFGTDLMFVFRHLPLADVHEHAELAAEAAEAAAAQGRFWEMHDVLFDHQDALTEEHVVGYARDLGLDEARFRRDLRGRRYALRVARDVASADESGAAGTPTFFVDGRRHAGPPNHDALAAAIRRELLQRARE
jgi:Na+/H+ antiporter NhaA